MISFRQDDLFEYHTVDNKALALEQLELALVSYEYDVTTSGKSVLIVNPSCSCSVKDNAT